MTNVKFQDHPIGLFTPPSVADFAERARNVSRFLGIGRRHAEERLAKLYGYAGAHDIRIAITKAQADGKAPGPYNHESSNYIFGKPKTIDLIVVVNRGNACLDMAMEVYGENRGEKLRPRTWAFRDIGLFSEIGHHRNTIRKYRISYDAIDVIDGQEPPGGDQTIRPSQDYATLQMRNRGEWQLAFTPLGEGLSKAIAHAMNPDITAEYCDRDKKLAVLQRLHPENPYIHAARCVNDCYDIHDGRPNPKKALVKALEHYDAAVLLFDRLYADMPEGGVHARTRSRSYMTSLEMDSSGMRVMCEQLLLALRDAGISGHIKKLTRQLAFFNVGRDGRDILAE